MVDNDDVELQNDLKIFDAVNAWLESNEYKPFWLKPLPLLAVSIIFTLVGLPAVGFGMLTGYLLWIVVTTPKKMRITFDLVKIFRPALTVNPEGLEDLETVKQVLNNAKVYETSSKKRNITLQAYLKKVLNLDTMNDVCKNGEHSEICKHNVSPETLNFWKSVARQPIN